MDNGQARSKNVPPPLQWRVNHAKGASTSKTSISKRRALAASGARAPVGAPPRATRSSPAWSGRYQWRMDKRQGGVVVMTSMTSGSCSGTGGRKLQQGSTGGKKHKRKESHSPPTHMCTCEAGVGRKLPLKPSRTRVTGCLELLLGVRNYAFGFLYTLHLPSRSNLLCMSPVCSQNCI